MKRNNKALYEQIMRNVAKEVKKVLNENSVLELDYYPELNDIFDDYDTDNIKISDFRITYMGTLITNIIRNPETGDISLWAGDPETDKFAEELIIDDRYKLEGIIENILDNL